MSAQLPTAPGLTPLVAGATVHLLSGTRYLGRFDALRSVGEPERGYRLVTSADGAQVYTRPEDAFATEADARAAAKARRQPRQTRQPNYGYGDGATLAMFARAGAKKAAR